MATAQAAHNLYGSDFHQDRDTRTRDTARLILREMFHLVQPESVCDVGCGVGTWLSVAREMGAETIQGFEGPWAKTANLVLNNADVSFMNLEDSVRSQDRFGLVISLEVAEHLSKDRARSFVADLCALGDVVLFSAAIPMQGGTGHINEQWQSYWADHFASQGFDAYDPVRPKFWNDGNIAFWYRQNMLVYAKQGSDAEAKLKEAQVQTPAILDLVHPDQYLHAEAAQPARALSRKVRQVFGRG